MDAPPITEALVEWLEGLFPDRIPETDASSEVMYRVQGQARVTRRVRTEYERQSQNILES